MKINRVRLYQAIQLDGKSETYFDVAKNTEHANRLGQKGYTVEQTANGVLFIGNSEAVLASWNNIAFVSYELPEKSEPAKKGK